MNEVYTFLTEAQLSDIKCMKVVIESIVKQTLECSYFIQGYFKDERFCLLKVVSYTAVGELTLLSSDEAFREHDLRN